MKFPSRMTNILFDCFPVTNPHLTKSSLFLLHAQKWFIVTCYLDRTLISILERKRHLCAICHQRKNKNVLLCFFPQEVNSPCHCKGCRTCSLYVPFSLCIIYDTGLGQSQTRRPQRILDWGTNLSLAMCLSQLHAHIKCLEMSTFIIFYNSTQLFYFYFLLLWTEKCGWWLRA